MIVTIYGGCWRCHSDTALCRKVETEYMRASECWSRRDCDRRRNERQASFRPTVGSHTGYGSTWGPR